MLSDADLRAAGAQRIERVGDAVLILGDCREIAPKLPRPDAIISDPPYGQGYRHGDGVRRFARWNDAGRPTEREAPPPVAGDDTAFDPSPWVDHAPVVLLWGAHQFARRLPAGTWLIWDKRPAGIVRDQGCGEVAWLNATRPLRIFRHLWDGICVADRADLADGRVHPMQKPIALMEWCLEQAKVAPGAIVLDPYMGSGTTGVACLRRGVRFVGIEIEPRYFDVACRRVAEAARQPALFHAVPQRQSVPDYPTLPMDGL